MLSPYLVENRHLAVKRCKHGLFMYNRNDSYIGRSLDLYGEWCDLEIQLLAQFIRPGDTVVDVGANIGTHTIAFANLVGLTGTVHAFEPQRRLFQMLCGNVALNCIENVFCHARAVGEASGEISIPQLPPPYAFFNFGAVPLTLSLPSHEPATMVTLDELKLDRCQVIKIDAEEMEARVLGGARETIAHCQPILYVENDRLEASKRLAPLLAEIGYRAYWSIFPYFDRRNFYSNTVNIWPEDHAPSANLLCLSERLKVEVPDAEPFLGEHDDWKASMRRLRERSRK
jgi:FkbM family methyltransferase